MEYLIKYETKIGTYAIDPNFNCIKGGNTVSEKPDNLQDAKDRIQKQYSTDLISRKARLQRKLDELNKAPDLIENTNLTL